MTHDQPISMQDQETFLTNQVARLSTQVIRAGKVEQENYRKITNIINIAYI